MLFPGKRAFWLLFIGLVGSLMSCDMSSLIGVNIPNIETFRSDERLSRNSNGVLLLSSYPYSGYVTTHSSSGNLINKKAYMDGKEEGIHEAYYENGNSRYIRPYKNGKKHGEHLGWFESGQQKFYYIFENGLSIGNHKEWYSDGSLAKDFNYQAGRPFGSQKVWRRDGKIRANYVIRENRKRYGLMGIKRCTKLDGETQEIDPYTTQNQ